MGQPKRFGRCIIVDDDPDILLSARLLLRDLFRDVAAFQEPEAALEAMSEELPDVILLDANFGRGATNAAEGFQWLAEILKRDPQAVVVMITAHAGVQTAVEAMKRGATDFVSKPWSNERLLATVRTAAALRTSREEAVTERKRSAVIAAPPGGDPLLLGQSPGMARVYSLIERAAPTDANVLILGENGTGKELVARELHRRSRRADNVLVSVDLGAVAESLFESELFGHVKGAFTDARGDRIGRLQAADGGTLFLDEIESMSLDVQVKLLRMLQERVVERLGGNQSIALDIRVIAATKEDLRHAADQGRFRADLYYRLNVAPLRIPPLRERSEDLLFLFQHFAETAASRHGLPIRELRPEQRAQLLRHAWPGNVRELQNTAERFALGLELGLEDPAQHAEGAPVTTATTLNEQVEAFERALIAAELSRPHSSLRSVAEALGLPRKTLHDKLRKHGLVFNDAGGTSPDEDD